MHILGVCATKNRHRHLEKLVGFFLAQEYHGEHTLLIYNNAIEGQVLGFGDGHYWKEGNKEIILMNAPTSLTGNPYTSLGQIYNDVLQKIRFIEPDLVNHMDDDDIYLPDHFAEGYNGFVNGMVCNHKAYKPYKSYFKSTEKVSLERNVLEPSIFVEYEHLVRYGYYNRNVDLHHKWVQPLIDKKQLYEDKNGKPTFVYDWGNEIPVWKTSGDPNNPENFNNYNKNSSDVGDQIITPLTKEQLQKYYI